VCVCVCGARGQHGLANRQQGKVSLEKYLGGRQGGQVEALEVGRVAQEGQENEERLVLHVIRRRVLLVRAPL
jgi:hypothetical protein